MRLLFITNVCRPPFPHFHSCQVCDALELWFAGMEGREGGSDDGRAALRLRTNQALDKPGLAAGEVRGADPERAEMLRNGVCADELGRREGGRAANAASLSCAVVTFQPPSNSCAFVSAPAGQA